MGREPLPFAGRGSEALPGHGGVMPDLSAPFVSGRGALGSVEVAGRRSVHGRPSPGGRCCCRGRFRVRFLRIPPTNHLNRAAHPGQPMKGDRPAGLWYAARAGFAWCMGVWIRRLWIVLQHRPLRARQGRALRVRRGGGWLRWILRCLLGWIRPWSRDCANCCGDTAKPPPGSIGAMHPCCHGSRDGICSACLGRQSSAV